MKLGLARKLNVSFSPVPVSRSAWGVDAKEPKFGVKEDPATDWLIIGEPVTELATTHHPLIFREVGTPRGRPISLKQTNAWGLEAEQIKIPGVGP